MKKHRFQKDAIVVLSPTYGFVHLQLLLVWKDDGKRVWARRYMRKSHRWTERIVAYRHKDVKRLLWTWPGT